MFGIYDHPAIGLTPVPCGRCKKVMVVPADADVCWYCLHPLCYECWDEYGHCGHPEADAANASAAPAERAAPPGGDAKESE